MDAASQAKIIIHRGSDEPGHYVWSPFVTKVELRCRMSNLKYSCGTGTPLAAPKGKIPYMEVSKPGSPSEFVADSTEIIKTLVSRDLLSSVNLGLSAKDVGHDLAIRALLEEKLYFYNTNERWILNFYIMREHLFGKMLYLKKILIGYMAYRGAARKLYDQGTGRFSDDEIRTFMEEIWKALAGMLQDSRKAAKEGECFWVLGSEEPTEADASLFGFIVGNLVNEAASISKPMMKKHDAVMDYATRIHHQYFPDYEIWK